MAGGDKLRAKNEISHFRKLLEGIKFGLKRERNIERFYRFSTARLL